MSKINVDSSNVEDLKINSSYDKKEEKIEEEEEEENEYNLIADEPNQTNEEAKENSIINNNNQKQNETNNSKFKNILGNISEYEDEKHYFEHCIHSERISP